MGSLRLTCASLSPKPAQNLFLIRHGHIQAIAVKKLRLPSGVNRLTQNLHLQDFTGGNPQKLRRLFQQLRLL